MTHLFKKEHKQTQIYKTVFCAFLFTKYIYILNACYIFLLSSTRVNSGAVRAAVVSEHAAAAATESPMALLAHSTG